MNEWEKSLKGTNQRQRLQFYTTTVIRMSQRPSSMKASVCMHTINTVEIYRSFRLSIAAIDRVSRGKGEEIETIC